MISILKSLNNLVTLIFQFVSNQDHPLLTKVKNNPTKMRLMPINLKIMLNPLKKLVKWEIIAISQFMFKEKEKNKFWLLNAHLLTLR